MKNWARDHHDGHAAFIIGEFCTLASTKGTQNWIMKESLLYTVVIMWIVIWKLFILLCSCDLNDDHELKAKSAHVWQIKSSARRAPSWVDRGCQTIYKHIFSRVTSSIEDAKKAEKENDSRGTWNVFFQWPNKQISSMKNTSIFCLVLWKRLRSFPRSNFWMTHDFPFISTTIDVSVSLLSILPELFGCETNSCSWMA